MKQDLLNSMKHVNVSVNLEKMFAIINNNKRWNRNKCRCECNKLIEVCVIMDLFGILVIVSVNVIKHVILVNI